MYQKIEKGNLGELQKLTELCAQLQEAADHAKRRADDAQRDLKAVQRAIELLRVGDVAREIEAFQSPLDSKEFITELRSKKTQLHALIAMARKNNGKLLTKDAKRLLLACGLMRPTKNANNILYNVINRSERFRHVGAGEYELIENPPARLVVPQKSELEDVADVALFPKPIQ